MIKLGSNIASMASQRRLNEASTALAKTFERLSSGMRINSASDDAAGLAIADSLRAESRIFAQGVRNLNDGISLLNIADSALENLSSIVTRLEELATQAANGSYGKKQRQALDAEAQALSKEFFRISKTAKFNGLNLLNGENPILSLQAGVGRDGVISTSVGGAIGTGSISEASTFSSTLAYTRAVELGDLNGDGFLDLVTTGGGLLSIATVQLGSGSGTFGSIATVSAGSSDLELADINNDGILDMITSDYDSVGMTGRAYVCIGNGNGTFGAVTSYVTDSHDSNAVTLGDLNGDGVLDLVTAGRDNSLNGSVNVRLGTGSGTFGAAISYASENGSSGDVMLGDINGDGTLDLVTVGYDDVGFQAAATVRLGLGNGSFGVAVSYVADGFAAEDGELADLNNDGVLDLVSVSWGGASGVANVRLGLGNGSFGVSTSYSTEVSDSYCVKMGDLNGDGFLDMITTGYSFVDAVTVRLGTGTGSFGAANTFGGDDPEGYSTLTIGDVNGDGVLDVIAATDYAPTSSLTIYLGGTKPGTAPLLPFSLKTMADARQALPVLQRKLSQLAAQRGEIGAYQARIEVATNTLRVSEENFKAAESRIRDADIAEESSKLIRQQILLQAASAILAQANQQPALALNLLKS